MNHALTGVNLGGWLVVEKWLTPGIFSDTDAIDEYTLSRHPRGKAILDKHRRSFITESDFKWLHDHSINLVRIPVGYWVFDVIDGYYPTVHYLDQAMKWAEKYEIDVIIDLHAAPGSQNGFDSSGQKGAIKWYDSDKNKKQTIDVLRKIVKRYSTSSSLWGIEILNEPISKGRFRELRRFHQDAYNTLSTSVPDHINIIFHDSFRPFLSALTFWPHKPKNIIMDVHWYAFPPSILNIRQYNFISKLLRQIGIRYLSLWQKIIVGEWSSVMPQKYFDAAPTNKHMQILEDNIAMQRRIYDRATAWTYWNYKAEGDGMWNFRDLVERKIIRL
jgi:glucan 1,3-beta-glucosidase